MANKPMIALVDDDEDSLALLEILLGDNYQVRCYLSGKSAIEAFESYTPDLIIADISMPGMGGTELLERLRQNEGLDNVNIIALTAHALIGDRERYLSQGFDEYIPKPILDEAELQATIAKVLSTPRSAKSHHE